MLDIRPNCECCNKDLPPAAADAMICSFECTFCRDCAEAALGGRCPNCGGALVARRSPRLIVPAIEATPHERREAAAARPGAVNPS